MATAMVRPGYSDRDMRDPLLHEQLSAMDDSVSTCLRRSGQAHQNGPAAELRAPVGGMVQKVDSLLMPWEHSLVAPRLERETFAFGELDGGMPSSAFPVSAAWPSCGSSYHVPSGSSAMQSVSPRSLGPGRTPVKRVEPSGRAMPQRIMAFPQAGHSDPGNILQRACDGLESTEVSRGVLLERVLSGIESKEINIDDGFSAFETGLLERHLPRGAAAVRMDLEGMIDSMLKRPAPVKAQKQDPYSATARSSSKQRRAQTPPAVLAPGISGCQRCEILSQQVAALAQALTGFCSLAYHWSAGLPEVRRRTLVELALDYAGPCAHICTDLADLCVELEHLRWGDNAPSPMKRPQGMGSKDGAVVLPEDEEAGKDAAEVRPSRNLDWWSDEPASPSLSPPDAEGARLVGNYSASRKDETVAYLVDNSKLKAKSAGLGYRRSPNLDDKDSRSFAKWGSIVQGTPFGSEWVQIEGRYLPRIVQGIAVIVPHAKNEPDRWSLPG